MLHAELQRAPMSNTAGYQTDTSTLLWAGVGLILGFAAASYLYSYLYDEYLFWTGQVSSFLKNQWIAIARVKLPGSKLILRVFSAVTPTAENA